MKPWKTAACSVIGRSHRELGVSCQDAFAIDSVTTAGQEWLVITCADGAGSASHGDFGARVVCDTLIRQIKLLLSSETSSSVDLGSKEILNCLAAAKVALEDRAKTHGLEARDLATTVLGAVIGDTRAHFLQVGDGAIVIADDEGHQRVVFWPQQGEYASETTFLTCENAMDVAMYEQVDDFIGAIAVFTDGIQHLVLDYSHRCVPPGFLSPVFSSLSESKDVVSFQGQLREFLAGDRFEERTDDDRTLVVAVPNRNG